MKEKFVGLLLFIQKYWIGFLLLATLNMLICWEIGYFANALAGSKFDLGSCWAGVGVIFSTGAVAFGKWIVDSWLNSPDKKMPEEA